jgi:hypothetical protein
MELTYLLRRTRRRRSPRARLAAQPTVVEHGDSYDFPPAIAELLLEQPDNWQRTQPEVPLEERLAKAKTHDELDAIAAELDVAFDDNAKVARRRPALEAAPRLRRNNDDAGDDRRGAVIDGNSSRRSGRDRGRGLHQPAADRHDHRHPDRRHVHARLQRRHHRTRSRSTRPRPRSRPRSRRSRTSAPAAPPSPAAPARARRGRHLPGNGLDGVNWPVMTANSAGFTGGASPTATPTITTPGSGYGTYVAATVFVEDVDENVDLKIQNIDGKGRRSGDRVMRVDRRIRNRKGAGGDLTSRSARRASGRSSSTCSARHR